MRIAVTGGMGFIGSEIVTRLLDLGHEVTVVDFWRRLIPEYERERFPIIEGIYQNSSLAADLVEPIEFLNSLEFCGTQHELIVHAGACVDTTRLDDELWQLNVEYTRRLVYELEHAGSSLVYLSSAAVYGAKGWPNNPYGLSKLLGEKAIRDLSVKSSSLRLFNVFGKLEHHKRAMASVPFKIAEAYRKGDCFRMFCPDAARDFVPVKVVVDAVMSEIERLSQDQAEYKCMDVGTGTATTFRDIDLYVKQAVGARESCVREITMPDHLEGRYQGYTCAGMYSNSRIDAKTSTRDGIWNAYYVR